MRRKIYRILTNVLEKYIFLKIKSCENRSDYFCGKWKSVFLNFSQKKSYIFLTSCWSRIERNKDFNENHNVHNFNESNNCFSKGLILIDELQFELEYYKQAFCECSSNAEESYFLCLFRKKKILNIFHINLKKTSV